MDYLFRKALEGDDKTFYSMIVDRIKWMDEENIDQWNNNGYLEYYTPEYFRKNLDKTYVLADKTDGRVVCAAVLLEKDPRWDTFDEPAFYIHNLASQPGSHGTGRIFIQKTAEFALSKGKEYLRLDSQDDNEKLTAYYESLGFLPCGTCEDDGCYKGILRQKKLI